MKNEIITSEANQDLFNLTGSLTPEAYWGNVEELRGDGTGPRNSHELEAFSRAMHDSEARMADRRRAAKDWYLRLGTHNSLYGMQGDLLLAARVLASGDELLDEVQMLDRLTGAKEISTDNAILVSQVLLDASKDPHPDSANKGTVLLGAVADVTKHIMKEQGALGEDRDLSPADKRRLSDAMKFNFEAEIKMIDNDPDSLWDQRYVIFQDKAAAGDKSAKRIIERVHDGEELKQRQLFQTLHRQAQELKSVAGKLTNGSMTEHYSMLLMRHYGVSKENGIQVEVTTLRQDAPRDGIGVNGAEYPEKMSHDMLIRGLQDYSEHYIQLKGGMGSDQYHEGVSVINPFNVHAEGDLGPEALKGLNIQVRAEVDEGLKQLIGALDELITGRMYQGSLAMLESHVKNIDQGLIRQPVGV